MRLTTSSLYLVQPFPLSIHLHVVTSKLVRDEGICSAQRAILAEFILSDIFTCLSCTTTTVQTSEILFCYFDCSEVPAVSDSHLPSTLKVLEQLPMEIDETYTEAIERINTQFGEDRELAVKILMWITTAFRPLTLLELQHALAVQPGDTNFDEGGITDEATLLIVCRGLVTLDELSQTV